MNVSIWSLVLGFEALLALGLALRLAHDHRRLSPWLGFVAVMLFTAAWLRPDGWLAAVVVALGLAVITALASVPSRKFVQGGSQQGSSARSEPVPARTGELPMTARADAVDSLTSQFVLVVDAEGNILHTNPAWTDRVQADGPARANLAGHLLDPSQFARLVDTLKDSGSAAEFPLEVQTRAGVRALRFAAKHLTRPSGQEEIVLVGSEVADPAPLRAELESKERQLAESEQQYRKLLESVTDYVYRVEVVGGQPVRTVHGPGALAVTGYKVSRFDHDPNLWLQMVYEEDRPIVLEQARRALAGGTVHPIEHRIVHRNGTVRWIRNTMVVHKQNGAVVSYEGLITDITERKMAEHALQVANEQLKSINEELRALAVDDALFNELQNSLSVCNTLAEALGVLEAYGPRLFPGSSGCLYRIGKGREFIESVCSWGERADFEVVVRTDQCWALRRSKPHGSLLDEPSVHCSNMRDAEHGYICVPLGALGEASGVLRIVLGSPPPHLGEESLHKHRAAKGSLAVKVADALSLSMANIDLRQQLTNQAVRDSLTGLFNRRYLEETLSREIRRAVRTKVPLSVVIFDIDHFKQFNDTYGHEAGDLALQQVAGYLLSNFRGDDVACRYGGEEFVLVMAGASQEDAMARCEQARLAIAELAIPCGGSMPATLTASFGVATYPADGSDGPTVLQRADQAMYRAKSWGRNRVVSSQQHEPGGVS